MKHPLLGLLSDLIIDMREGKGRDETREEEKRGEGEVLLISPAGLLN